MRIAICEDDATQAQALRRKIELWAAQAQATVLVEHFESGESFLGKWSDQYTYDMAFLDIQMKLVDGMELAKMIRKIDSAMTIIFVTGLRDFVFRGYEVQALRYLLKPIKQSDCSEALDLAYSIYKNKRDDLFVIRVETQSVRLLLNDIYYFEMRSHYVDVKTNRGNYSYKERIGDLQARLPKARFFMCNRSIIVNLYYVHVINPEMLRLDTGEVLPVAKSRWKQLNEAFIAFHAGKST